MLFSLFTFDSLLLSPNEGPVIFVAAPHGMIETFPPPSLPLLNYLSSTQYHEYLRNILSHFFLLLSLLSSSSHPPVANQFIDPLILLKFSKRRVGFCAAKHSMERFWVGLFARSLQSSKVKSP